MPVDRHPPLDDYYDYIQKGVGRIRNAVLTELDTAIIDCGIAKRRRLLDLDITANLERARMRLQTAEKYIWRFRMQHREFDQMTALVVAFAMAWG